MINGNKLMIMGNRINTDNVKIASITTGIENDGLVMNMNSDVDSLVKTQAVSSFNQEVNDYVERFDKHKDYLEMYKEQFKEDAKNLEVMPIYRYALIQPFNENPFQQMKQENGIITDLGGQKPIYKSNETGDWEEEESYIHVGTVMEVGPKCEYLKEGDVVMFPKTGEVPVPFYKMGLVIVDECRVIAVINEGLKERFYGNH